MQQLCLCGSGITQEMCCQPYLLGERYASTPVALMRSRYSAYVMKDADYLIDSWHPECSALSWRENLIEGFANTQWLGLRVISEQAGKDINEGYVEFAARYQEQGTELSTLVHERSRFLRINERWYYIDGIKPQTGRNDICPCGSGKKYKKCCG